MLASSNFSSSTGH